VLVATAAYGSVMANDVAMLRRFRDGVLERTVLGELAVETYYTFGPAVAGMIGESELVARQRACVPHADRRHGPPADVLKWSGCSSAGLRSWRSPRLPRPHGPMFISVT